MSMRLTLNPAHCDGFGFCAEMPPELVSLDEWEFLVLSDRGVPQSLVRAAGEAVRFCPRRALELRLSEELR